MVHVQALPGSPFSSRSIDLIERVAVDEARMLIASGFEALIVENMHDRPYLIAPHPPEVTASMTRLVMRIREAVDRMRPGVPIGVQILSAGELEAMAAAMMGGGCFVRVENFSFAHVADEGLLDRACAGPLLRARRALGLHEGQAAIRVFCDVKKKHASHAITADVTLAEAAHSAELFGADAVIVTGTFTGKPTSPADVAKAAGAVSLPVLVGSGVTPEQVRPLFDAGASGLIVGTYIKQGGVWSAPVDPARCDDIVRARG